MARDELSSPRGVAFNIRLTRPARMNEVAMLRAARLGTDMSSLPGWAQRTARYPGIRKIRTKRGADSISWYEEGERWIRARAATGISTDALRCRGGGQASLIFFFLLLSLSSIKLKLKSSRLTDKTFFLGI